VSTSRSWPTAESRREYPTVSTVPAVVASKSDDGDPAAKEDDDDDDEDDDGKTEHRRHPGAAPIDGTSAVVGGTEDVKHDGKTKREHGVQSAQRRDSPYPAVAEQAVGDLPHVTFKSLVQVKVSAFITWPDSVVGVGGGGQQCSVAAAAGGAAADVGVVGYRLRYQAVDDDVREYVTQNLSANFVLLENLLVNARYKYQVKYLLKNGTASEWSASGELDTRYTALN